MGNAREKQTAPFKVGSLVRVASVQDGYGYFQKGDVGTVLAAGSNTYVNFKDTGHCPANNHVDGDGHWWVGKDNGKSSLELVNDSDTQFHVGDRVTVVDHPYSLHPNQRIGTIERTGIMDDRRGSIEVCLDNYCGATLTFNPCELRKAEDAPVKVAYDSPEYARSLEQEIIRLTAEVATLRSERNKWTEEAANYAQNSDHHNAKREEAESALLEARKQLEDIAAIERVNRLVSALHGTDLKQDWTFHGLIIAVTEGKVAA